MAHSDVLIFLTNITWTFLLFLFVYFFFVLFFLPTFYKKVRARALIHVTYERAGFAALKNSYLGSYMFVCDSVKDLFIKTAAVLIAQLGLISVSVFGLVNFKNSLISLTFGKLDTDTSAEVSKFFTSSFNGVTVDNSGLFPTFTKYFR